ncbi:hypothetical protein CDD81_7983 [Ophiocordyceps australis]|uniref:UBR-type domain-containing protein n=1 Tax=Ophiocordyceps australis TaxID=1399860 RepID=A0A2C5Y3G6_9HYPO|nr:hypothetical protein CDD81_7983 [Ophiocordyceps australis]
MPADSAPPDANGASPVQSRGNSFSQHSRASDDSQTAADFIRNQELLEADAREALPYSIDMCTKTLGPLRQNVFACLTCNPAPSGGDDSTWQPAGVCYACSVQCHGEHNLVEIFQKRNFTCDCGTTRFPAASACVLRINEETGTKGGVHSEEADANNRYNQNFRNRFCGCQCDYDPFQQKGTMFQCLGLGTEETGGCGEDWYHPGCLVGMGPKWYEQMEGYKPQEATRHDLATMAPIPEEQQPDTADGVAQDAQDDDPPMPPGFPDEDSFESFLCYKCVGSNPWIKQYAGTRGFLPAVLLNQPAAEDSKKRKADDESERDMDEAKRIKTDAPEDQRPHSKTSEPDSVKAEEDEATAEPLGNVPSPNKTQSCFTTDSTPICKLGTLPPPPNTPFSLFLTCSFRSAFCTCPPCRRRIISLHPQLVQEEEVYEPPLSSPSLSRPGSPHSTHGSGSILERGESALRNMDRVRAIEGVMAYNHLKEKLKPFFQRFAESGQAVGAEDIKAYFAELRGDDKNEPSGEAAGQGGEVDHRREQDGC